MRGVFVVEVDAIVLLVHLQHLLVSVVLEDQLLDKEEGLLVLDVLSDLDYCSPSVRRELLLAIVALSICFHKLHQKGLLD